MVGAFPGFIWGWFQVPDFNGITGFAQLLEIYQLPMIGALATGLVFFILTPFIWKDILIPIFSSAAISCYYWFRIPALFGFGVFPGDGMLIDLTGTVSELLMAAIQVAATLFFFTWMVLQKQSQLSWVIRPSYAVDISSST